MSGHIHFVFGNDDYLLARHARTIVDATVPVAERDFGLEIVEGACGTIDTALAAVGQCTESLCTPAFFGGVKLTWFRGVTFLPGGEDPASNESVKAALTSLLDHIKTLPEGQAFLLTAPRVLKTSIFFKTCQTLGEVVVFDSDAAGGAFARAAVFAQELGLTFAPGVQRDFADKVGEDSRTMMQELEKLRAYLGAETEVTAEAVSEITSVSSTPEIWDLKTAVGQRNAVDALRILRRYSGKKGVGMMICPMLDKFFRELLFYRDAYERQWITTSGWSRAISVQDQVVLNASPINQKTTADWLVKRNLPSALKFSVNELRLARHVILNAREMLVTAKLPEMHVLEMAILRIIGTPKRR